MAHRAEDAHRRRDEGPVDHASRYIDAGPRDARFPTARRAADLGVDGIVVSNHGGRQVDGSIATLSALPAIKEAVPDGYPLLLDSGIRTGADVVKAMALGASAVLLGRPYIWALGVGGESGVRQLLRAFLADVDLTLALSGYTTFADVDAGLLVGS